MSDVKIEEIVNHYFQQLEKDITHEKVNEEGVTGYLIAIAEYWEILSKLKSWKKYVYYLLFCLSNMIKKDISVLGIGCYGGWADILWTVSFLASKIENITPFLCEIREVAISLFFSNLAYLEKQLENEIVKTEYYDLVNGVSGVGMYYLSCESRNIKENEYLRKIIKYLIKVHHVNRETTGWMVKRENLTRMGDQEIFDKGCVDLGMSHGIIGVALFLAKAAYNQIIEEGQRDVINDIINIYMNLRRENEMEISIWPSQLGEEDFKNQNWEKDIRKKRVSWCYGNIGILRGMFLIGNYIKDERIKLFSFNQMLHIANMKLKDYKLESPILCHGYAGLIVILNLFYRETNEEIFSKKVRELIKFEKKYFKREYAYGFINQGIITINGKQELEQYDLLNSATGIILALSSVEYNKTGWEERMFLV